MVVAMVALGVTANPDYPEKTDEMVATDETEPTGYVALKETKETLAFGVFPVFKASVAPKESRATPALKDLADLKVIQELEAPEAPTEKMDVWVPGGCQA